MIDKLRKEYDLTKDADILDLYARLQNDEFDLTSPEGRAFDDEVYEKAMAVKQRKLRQQIEDAETLETEHKKTKNGSTASVGGRVKKANVIVLTRREMKVRRIVFFSLFFIMLGCLTYFGIYVYDAMQADAVSDRAARRKNNQAIRDMYKDQDVGEGDSDGGRAVILDEYKSLYVQNKNLIGWLEIADTNIDNPVMQTSDNTFYLNHDINRKEDKNGTLFLDAACDVLLPSQNLIIYGHNMRSGNMFGSLDKYKSEDYCKKHSEILFDTIYEKGVYEVMYVFNSRVYSQDEIVFKYYQFINASSEEEFDSNMRAMEEMSLYDTGVRAQYGDRLLTLSTCDYLEDDSRFVVVARKVG